METIVATATPTAAGSRPSFRPASFADAVRSEWTKVRSVRSTYWCLLVAALLGIGLGALISAVTANHYASDPSLHPNWNPTDRSQTSLAIAQLVFAILGVLVVTGEYSTGMIRTSLAAVPKRGRLLVTKGLVLVVITVIAGEAISFITFFLGQALISGKAPSASIGQHEVLRAVLGAGLYLPLLALLGFALGWLVRHAAAAIGIGVAILLVLPGIGNALPSSWSQPIEKFWPTNAGQQIAIVARGSHTLTPWLGLGLMALFVIVMLGAAAITLQRRDA